MIIGLNQCVVRRAGGDGARSLGSWDKEEVQRSEPRVGESCNSKTPGRGVLLPFNSGPFLMLPLSPSYVPRRGVVGFGRIWKVMHIIASGWGLKNVAQNRWSWRNLGVINKGSRLILQRHRCKLMQKWERLSYSRNISEYCLENLQYGLEVMIFKISLNFSHLFYQNISKSDCPIYLHHL